MLTTRVAIPDSSRAWALSTASETSEPVAIKINCGDLLASLRIYAPRATPSTEPNFVRSKTGKFCLDNKIPDALRPLMIIFHAAATSFASAGLMTSKSGIARRAAKCSIGW